MDKEQLKVECDASIKQLRDLLSQCQHTLGALSAFIYQLSREEVKEKETKG